MRVTISSLALSVLVACGSSGDRSGFDPNSSGSSSSSSSSSSGGSSSGFGGDGGSTSSGGNQDGCSDAAKLVYVVSDDDLLFSFKPDTLEFKTIGALGCPSGGATPNSMAVDRSGTAWVNYSDGALFKVSTTDASCTATNFQKNQSGFSRFGMAFASNGPGSKEETLYVVGIEALNNGKGLAKIDLGTMVLTPIGDFSGALAGKGAELTGTGDGKLYGFFTTSPNATLAQIDPATGATSNNVSLYGVKTGQAWAFSFWGGDFWFYTSNGIAASIVTRYQPADNDKISNVKQDVGGFKIVGAGVSTCAPTGPVR